MSTDITKYLPFIDKCFSPVKYVLAEIEAGLSDDVKFRADLNGQSYIVKIVEGRREAPYDANRIIWYRALCMANKLDGRIVCPKWFDYIGDHVVTITGWKRGISLEEYLYNNPDKMTEYGIEIGKLLHKIHNFGFIKSEIKKSGEKFAPKILKKVDGLLESVGRLNISFAGIEKVTAYLRENGHVVSEDRAGILHNDVRPENFILDDGGIYIFDFDSGTISDCYADFTYLTVLADKTFRVCAYAAIRSYFGGDIPEDFWRANLYFSLIKLLEYAVYKFKKSGKAVVNQAKNFLEVFNNYDDVIPSWWNEIDGQYGKYFIQDN